MLFEENFSESSRVLSRDFRNAGNGCLQISHDSIAEATIALRGVFQISSDIRDMCDS